MLFVLDKCTGKAIVKKTQRIDYATRNNGGVTVYYIIVRLHGHHHVTTEIVLGILNICRITEIQHIIFP